MELTCINYEKEENRIIELIKTCDYISFDLEMTGIENDENNILFDTPENRYIKYKKTSEKYSIIQLGLTIFNREKNVQNNTSQIIYNCYPYNLYLFPNANDLKTLSQDSMNLEIKSMLFNRKGKLDFNKWINEGIYYLNQKQYRNLYKNITQNNINNDDFYIDTSFLSKKPSDLEQAENTIKEIRENFVDVKIVANSYIIDYMPKFMLYYIKKKLPNNLYFKENCRIFRNWCTLITRFKNQEEKDELYKNDVLSQLRELEHKKGVKKITDAIFNKFSCGNVDVDKNFIEQKFSKNKLIGHNMSLDLMFIISNLGESLPDKYTDFKKMIKNSFDTIYDTKLLFEEFKKNEINKNNIAIKDVRSVLDNMYPYLKSRYDHLIKFVIKTKNDEFKEDQFHSAGYDSYITGQCFLYLLHGDVTGQILNKNKNKIYLMNSLYKSMDLNKTIDDYILEVDNPKEDIYVFRGVKKTTNINFENIFGKLWKECVIKTIYDEKYNIIIAFTNLKKEIIDQRKTEFKVISKSKAFNDTFTAFTLEEFRIKYMKN